jgi:hypothetical protein
MDKKRTGITRKNGKITKEYRAWKMMKARCYSPCNKNMGKYQSLGIKVCNEWKNSFKTFLKDMGECPEGYTLDRIDSTKDYSKENCRWTDWKTQSSNRGSFNILIEYNGKTMILKDWAKEFNINYTTLYNRIYRENLTFQEAIQEDPFNKLIEYKGFKNTIGNWAKILNVKSQILIDRLRRGWTVKEAFEIPVGTRRNKYNNG